MGLMLFCEQQDVQLRKKTCKGPCLAAKFCERLGGVWAILGERSSNGARSSSWQQAKIDKAPKQSKAGSKTSPSLPHPFLVNPGLEAK
jgi:hypothetical protein